MNPAIEELKRVQQLLDIEKEEGVRQFRELLEKADIATRKRTGMTWYPLVVNETGFGLGDYPWLELERTAQRGTQHQFRPGNMVGLFSNSADAGGEEAQGVVHWVERDKMKVILYQNDHPDWLDDGKLGINLLFDTNSFKEMEKALQTVIEADRNRLAELRDTLLGNRQPETVDRHVIELPQLNQAQNDALNLVIQAKDVALVHGPPGTGKTTTLVQVVKQLVKHENNLLVCAPSNAAADLLTERIAAEGISVARVGNLSRVDPAVLSHTLEQLLANHNEAATVKEYKRKAVEFRKMAGKYKRKFGPAEREQRKALYKEARDLSMEAVRLEDHLIDSLLNKTNVVTCTLVGAQNRYIREREFGTVIIDEAAQALEPAAWIPIAKAQKVVMAGDPWQLPPTLLSTKAQADGLAVTLMEKTIQRQEASVLLDTQYRMNATIMGFSNERFYEGRLKAADTVADWTLSVSDEFAQPLEFIDTAGCGFEEKTNEESQSLCNPEEFGILRKHLEALLAACGEQEISVGVISPYREQVTQMRDALAGDATFESVDINTIDSFQGQERDVIYLSLVRSNEKAEIGFLSDYRRMNVAMTRARKKLVIVGDSATLGSHEFYQQFLDYAERTGSYRSAWEWIG